MTTQTPGKINTIDYNRRIGLSGAKPGETYIEYTHHDGSYTLYPNGFPNLQPVPDCPEPRKHTVSSNGRISLYRSKPGDKYFVIRNEDGTYTILPLRKRTASQKKEHSQ